jgi:F0F1-type ATP synthase membrane subunit c/vacuolar-type H+-ATPase subunit K
MFNKKLFELGGIAASIVLIAFGIGAIALGINGRSTVRDSLKLEQIVGSPDMTRDAIAAEAKKAGLTNVVLPGGDVAGKPINTGERARWFAGYMRIHALEASGGLTYAQMPRFATADGKGTNDEAAALKSPSGQPMSNAARDLWVTETALTTALNTSYMAEQLALFGLVVGIALLLSGIGFGVLTLGGALKRRPESSTVTRQVPVAAV